MNSVELIGRLVRDPDLGYTPGNNTAVCKFTIAVNRPRRNGEDQGADYIRIVTWGNRAETCDQYLSKGRQVAVTGRLQTGKYKNDKGDMVYTTDVVADNVEFLAQSHNNSQGNIAPGPGFKEMDCPSRGPEQMDMTDYPDSFSQAEDDIPF